MTVDSQLILGISLLYISILFLVAYYGEKRLEARRSIIANPYVYSLSISVYATSWTFYGSVGKAATTGLDFLLIYLGPSLSAFAWWFLLRKTVRITKENNITSIADFLSSRYGKSQWIGGLVTLIALLGIMPYIALQLKAVSTTYETICGSSIHLSIDGGPDLDTSFFAAAILGTFGVIFGARRLVSSERHEGLVAAIAVEAVVKLFAFLAVGIYVSWFLFDGVGDIFVRMDQYFPELLQRLTTFGPGGGISYPTLFANLAFSMGAIMLLPRQFHIMVIENSDESHIKTAMWLFPSYLFLINLFVMPVALGGILATGSNWGADFFVLTLPLRSGHQWLAILAFLGGLSAAAGMVMVESVAISTMVLDHLLMPILVRLRPRSWFPVLLINLKRFGILLVVFLGFLYYRIVGESYMLVSMGITSFVAAAQFGPAFIGALYWKRGNRSGAILGTSLGFAAWFYTLLLPSIINGGWDAGIPLLENGPFGFALLRPTALFGLTGFDMATHALFWSMFVNVAGYLAGSILLPQDEREREQAKKFVDVFLPPEPRQEWERKRLSKPITIMQFVNLMSKFVGETQAHAAIAEYMGNQEIDENGRVSEFELPGLKRFIEKTLAASVGSAAAGAIVESYLSDIGSKMESFYDAFSTVRSSLAESREALYVRLRASEIMNRTLDIQIILDDLLHLIWKEFKLDLVVVRVISDEGFLVVRSYRGTPIPAIIENDRLPEINTYIGDAFLANKIQFINDIEHITKPETKRLMTDSGIRSFAHIPIAREGEPPIGILSVFSRSIVGLFTEPFLQLLSSLAGQLAQAVTIVAEMEARERERQEKELALLENAKVLRDMEIAKQIQMSLLPESMPELPGIRVASLCLPAAHVGGDYYDFFPRGEGTVEVAIADVSGHSVGAALIMAETRSVLRAQAGASGPAETLARLNEILYDDLTRAELFITMFFVAYDSGTRRLTYANAGHNHPLLLRSPAGTCLELDAEGLILGVKKGVPFEENSLELLPGDLLLLYTDGIIEAQNLSGEFFGMDRLCAALNAHRGSSPEEVLAGLMATLKEFLGTASPADDISLVTVVIE